jgi:hypothetical protein
LLAQATPTTSSAATTVVKIPNSFLVISDLLHDQHASGGVIGSSGDPQEGVKKPRPVPICV